MSKTPQFDAAIAPVLASLVPHKRVCRQCDAEFEVLKDDIEMYRMFKVPAPTLCPMCRMQRRLAWRILLIPIFYKKQCAAPGHSEQIISFYSSRNPTVVYDDQYYVSDQWDALTFGKQLDPSQSFFDQFRELARVVPHQALQRDLLSVDCEYTISGKNSKNCYWVAVPWNAEYVYYSYLAFDTKFSIDLTEADHCDQCYECVYVLNCYNCKFCFECTDCLDSWFLFDCKNCSDCFGSTNLRNRRYVFFNEQLTKEQYQQKLKEIDLSDRKVLDEYREKFEGIMRSVIRRDVTQINTTNCVGDMLENSRNCFWAFRSTSGTSENLRYLWSFNDAKDCMDVYGTSQSSLIYESTAAVNAQSVKFSIMARTGRDLEYCVECRNCEMCFGCFGLTNKKFCIFNVQYTEDQYWPLVDAIKTKMLERREYGEFFATADSPHPYQDSSAGAIWPLSKNEIIERRWHWEEEEPSKSALTPADDIIICRETGKPFRLTKFELDFYHQHKLPLPVVHPLQRFKKRFSYRHPWNLFDSTCSKCDRSIRTVFDPALHYTVYCDTCYKQEVL